MPFIFLNRNLIKLVFTFYQYWLQIGIHFSGKKIKSNWKQYLFVARKKKKTLKLFSWSCYYCCVAVSTGSSGSGGAYSQTIMSAEKSHHGASEQGRWWHQSPLVALAFPLWTSIRQPIHCFTRDTDLCHSLCACLYI